MFGLVNDNADFKRMLMVPSCGTLNEIGGHSLASPHRSATLSSVRREMVSLGRKHRAQTYRG
ncbi:hypothetical protein NXC24_PB00222 (plasmid) [Rhizobium sp. NXC24]|nr:hypothetical protein NXC24_PB00222 [Rhizobium sp. NXC24]